MRIKQHARYTNGVSVPSEYVGGEYTVMQVLTGRVLIKELYSWVENRYVEKAQNTPAVQADELKEGDRVQILSGAVYTNGVRVPSRYVGDPFTVAEVRQEKILVLELNSWVNKKYVKKV